MKQGLLVCFAAVLVTSVQAEELISEFNWGSDFRFRYESVDDSRNDKATAITVRGTLNVEIKNDKGLGFLVETEVVQGIGEYHDGHGKEHTEHAVIADPDTFELNRMYVSFSPAGETDTEVQVGRFNCNHANESIDRHLSNIGWRQNHRTYDGVNVDSKWAKNRIQASYLVNVNRVHGDNHPNPVRANWKLNGIGMQYDYRHSEAINLEGYLYHYVFDDVPRFSTRTLGAKLFGKLSASEEVDFLYNIDLATQEGIDQNPNKDDSYGYSSVAVGLGLPNFYNSSFTVHNETLDSNGQEAFITPLGSGHAFFGWADKFLNQPPTGIVDTNFKVAFSFQGISVRMRWHEFSSDSGGIDYGSEFDWALGGRINEKSSWILQAYHYTGGSDSNNYAYLSNDTDKVVAWVTYSL